jgi:hypothetical protein
LSRRLAQIKMFRLIKPTEVPDLLKIMWTRYSMFKKNHNFGEQIHHPFKLQEETYVERYRISEDLKKCRAEK